MNIKGFSPISKLDLRVRQDSVDTVKTKESSDRDADGRQQNPDQEARRHLNDTELQECLGKLKAHAGIQSNGLLVRVEVHADYKVIYIEDAQGNLVKRLSEADLWSVTQNFDQSKGRLLNRAS
jgi:hypothetical protein